MKTKILTSIMICACSLSSIQAQEPVQEWEWVCSLLVDESLSKVCTQGTDTVYVIGENGLIAQSADKGLTWNKSYFSGKETLNDIIFCNHEIGFIVGNNGTILRTQDAGSSWEQMTSETVQHINAIAAFDLNNIWAVGNAGLVIHSADMGETWTAMALLSSTQDLNDVKCKGNRGYIAGNQVVLHTGNGGATWNEQVLTQYYGIRSLSITDNKVYALGEYIIYTEDNVNWNILDGTHGMEAIYFQDDQKGFLSSYDMTTDGGTTFFSTISKTTNGGHSWEYIYGKSFPNRNCTDNGPGAPFTCSSPETLHKHNFAFSSDNEFGYCVGVGYYLMRTPNTGEFIDCQDDYWLGMNVVKPENPVLTLNQDRNELQINSYSKKIDRVELIAIDGRKIVQEIAHGNVLNINISSLPKGTYLINVLFSDQTSYFDKWIKN